MYVYDEYDQRSSRTASRSSVIRPDATLAGELSEEEFRFLCACKMAFMFQRFAPMLWVVVPYGQLTSRQTRMMAKIARDYDKGYAHISTRQNAVQLAGAGKMLDILAELATVQMHAYLRSARVTACAT